MTSATNDVKIRNVSSNVRAFLCKTSKIIYHMTVMLFSEITDFIKIICSHM